MTIFVIPTWHPTIERPNWCRWIIPHIEVLRDQGHTVVVLQVDTDSGAQETGIQTHYLGDPNHYYSALNYPKTRLFRTVFCYGKFLKAYTVKLEELYDLAVEEHGQPDVLHAHVSAQAGYGASQLSQKYGVPAVVTEHYSGFMSDVKFPWRLTKFIKKMMDGIAGFYAVSPGFAQAIERTGVLTPSGVLCNPINTQLFTHDLAVKLDTTGPYHIVSTGDVGWVKGTDLLIQAVLDLPAALNWKLTIVGNQNKGFLEQAFDGRSQFDRVTFLEKQPQSSLADLYNQADLYVVSSRVETANVSMLEALSCGTPVVVTSCGAPESLVDDRVSRVAETDDSASLSEAIYQMYSNQNQFTPEKLREFVVQNYSKEALYMKLMKLYEKLGRNSDF